MQAKAWKFESNPMLAMTVYVRHQSRGMPMNVKVDGEYAPFFEKGKKFYLTNIKKVSEWKGLTNKQKEKSIGKDVTTKI